MSPQDKLTPYPVEQDFRLRGIATTRTETFTDAAFAFAVTLLVISTGELPDTMDEFVLALRRIPAFVASFALLAMFWSAHNKWSRRYGIEDSTTRSLSLGFVLTVLVFVYPLRMVAASFFSVLSRNWFPAELQIRTPSDLQFLFAVYAAGYLVLCAFMLAFHAVALKRAADLDLDAVELHDTRTESLSWTIQVATALVAFALAMLREPPPFDSVLSSGLPGFAFSTLAITMPALGIHREREHRRLVARRVHVAA